MEQHILFISLGCLFFMGLLADYVGHKTHLPRITLLILTGLIVGQSGFNLVPVTLQSWYEFLASMALTMVAFLLGGTLSIESLKEYGKEIVLVSLIVVIVTSSIILISMLLLGVGFILALMLAGISAATAPAATQDVVRQSGIDNKFTKILLGIVAIDDAWALILFSGFLVIAKGWSGDGGEFIFQTAVWEIGGSFALGLCLGLPAAYLTGRIQKGEPIQSEALGLVFLCAGLAIWLEVSFLLAGIVLGATIRNLAKHHQSAFHEIEHIEWPFMILFFILAGATLNLSSLLDVSTIGVVYIGLRFFSRPFGGWISGKALGYGAKHGAWYGVALLPQAGVAMGMAIVASNHFPELRDSILTIAIASTVVFELIGPIFTMMAINRSVNQAEKNL